jgi:hypothetical protein
MIKDIYQRQYNEYLEVAEGECEQLKEGYSHLSKAQLKKITAFYNEILSACDMLAQEAKVNRAPRAKKAKPVEKIIAKLKYQKSNEPLKLVSINPAVSRDAIVKLSELLRFTLQYNKEQEIPLQEEHSEVKKYLELEQLRFGERLQVYYNIPEAIQRALIPPAILLTLAENAVKHGISQSSKPGEIIIEGKMQENDLIISMKNTGVYVSGERVGIGLLHIRRRLEELYKGNAVLTIENGNSQVIATLKIPQV